MLTVDIPRLGTGPPDGLRLARSLRVILPHQESAFALMMASRPRVREEPTFRTCWRRARKSGAFFKT
ncbi:hypothetical protein [Hoeflea sp.]|uniref:hypothetical protein n=1 Tax=Hoeflea sp. TaxID=1940281 RepID=UPI0025C533F7|nr:hypothetical protein [Hoeflea sp.]